MIIHLSNAVEICACLGNDLGKLDVRFSQYTRDAFPYRSRLLHAGQILHAARARCLAYGASIRQHQLVAHLLPIIRNLFFLRCLAFSLAHLGPLSSTLPAALTVYDGVGEFASVVGIV